MNEFKKEVLKWFNVCFSNPTRIGKSSSSDIFSLNGLIVIFHYDIQKDEYNNQIQLFIANFEHIKNETSVLFNQYDSRETLVVKLDNFKKRIIEHKLVGERIYS